MNNTKKALVLVCAAMTGIGMSSCKNNSVAWEDCKTDDTKCEEAADGSVYVSKCIDGYWEVSNEDCSNRVCDNDKKACIDNVCDYVKADTTSVKIADGKQICDGNIIVSCKDFETTKSECVAHQLCVVDDVEGAQCKCDSANHWTDDDEGGCTCASGWNGDGSACDCDLSTNYYDNGCFEKCKANICTNNDFGCVMTVCLDSGKTETQTYNVSCKSDSAKGDCLNDTYQCYENQPQKCNQGVWADEGTCSTTDPNATATCNVDAANHCLIACNENFHNEEGKDVCIPDCNPTDNICYDVNSWLCDGQILKHVNKYGTGFVDADEKDCLDSALCDSIHGQCLETDICMSNDQCTGQADESKHLIDVCQQGVCGVACDNDYIETYAEDGSFKECVAVESILCALTTFRDMSIYGRFTASLDATKISLACGLAEAKDEELYESVPVSSWTNVSSAINVTAEHAVPAHCGYLGSIEGETEYKSIFSSLALDSTKDYLCNFMVEAGNGNKYICMSADAGNASEYAGLALIEENTVLRTDDWSGHLVEGTPDVTCTGDYSKCEGKTLTTCVTGNQPITTQCDTCGEDVFNPGSYMCLPTVITVCNPHFSRCDGNNLMTCGNDGKSETKVDCTKAGLACRYDDYGNGHCTEPGICTAGSTRCNGHTLYTCNDSGDDQVAYGCDAADGKTCGIGSNGVAQCVSEIATTCTPGATRCGNDTYESLYTCNENGTAETVQFCRKVNANKTCQVTDGVASCEF